MAREGIELSVKVAVIPARFGSTRFPGKPLARLDGKPLIVHVIERVLASRVFDEVRVATDDDQILQTAKDAGAVSTLSRDGHETGTSRVAEAVRDLARDSVVFNVQGDEPLLAVTLLRELAQVFEKESLAQMVTAVHRSTDSEAFRNPNVVKVVVNAQGNALYFSRSPIPWQRPEEVSFLRHIGIYGFRKQALDEFVAWPAGVLETREGLEQLRALENGIPIRVVETPYESIGVDTPEDLKSVALKLKAKLESTNS